MRSSSGRRDEGALIALGIALAAIVICTWIYSDKSGPLDPMKPVYWGLFTLSDTLAQWIVALFTIAATLVSYYAVRLIRATLDANTAAVNVARAANTIAEEAAEKQLRAYVHVVSVDLEHANDEYAPTITVKYKNFGQTPARNVINHLAVSFVLIGDAKHREREETNERGYDLGPGQDSSTSTHVSLDNSLFGREMLVKKAAKMYVLGTIEYKDVFGRENRYTRYKLHLHPDPEAVVDTDAFIVCPDGNDAN